MVESVMMGGLALPLAPCGPQGHPLVVVSSWQKSWIWSSRRRGAIRFGAAAGQVSGATTPFPGAWAGWWLGRAADAPRAAGGPAHISARCSCVAVL